jgi:hypothetical protein
MFWKLPKFDEACKSSAYSQKRRETRNFQFRPLSNFASFSKILEMLIYKRVATFLNKHNMISEPQKFYYILVNTIHQMKFAVSG